MKNEYYPNIHSFNKRIRVRKKNPNHKEQHLKKRDHKTIVKFREASKMQRSSELKSVTEDR